MNYTPAPPTTDLLQIGDPVVHNTTKCLGIVHSVEMNGDQQRAKVMWMNGMSLNLVLSSALTKVQDPYIRIGELESQVTALMSNGANAARELDDLRARLKESRDDVDYLEGRRDKLLRKVKKLKAAAPKKAEMRRVRLKAIIAASDTPAGADRLLKYAGYPTVEQPKAPTFPPIAILSLAPGEKYEALSTPLRYRNQEGTEVVFVGQIVSEMRISHYVTRDGSRLSRELLFSQFIFMRREPSNGEG